MMDGFSWGLGVLVGRRSWPSWILRMGLEARLDDIVASLLILLYHTYQIRLY